MKKRNLILAILVTVAIGFAISGCTGNKKNQETQAKKGEDATKITKVALNEDVSDIDSDVNKNTVEEETSSNVQEETTSNKSVEVSKNKTELESTNNKTKKNKNNKKKPKKTTEKNDKKQEEIEYIPTLGSTLDQAIFLIDSMYEEENIIVSPASLNMVLGMVANGASSNCQQELVEYLGEDINQYNEYSKNLLKRCNDDKMLKISNAVWYKNEYKINSVFANLIGDYYLAEINEGPLDETTVKEINNWADEKTDGLIKNILDHIPEEAIAIYANALLFDGKWTSPFKAYNTFDDEFSLFSGRKNTVSMMKDDVNIYYENDYAVGFEKTYGKNKEYSFIAILPKSKEEFVLSDLDISGLLNSKTDSYLVHIGLPKFEYEWKNDQMVDVLKEAGISSLFSGNSLDKTFDDCSKDLNLNQVMQTCKIIVDEEGTKAAAITTMFDGVSAVLGDNSKTVVLNRPFAYIIKDNTTKEVLFMGKVIDLKK